MPYRDHNDEKTYNQFMGMFSRPDANVPLDHCSGEVVDTYNVDPRGGGIGNRSPFQQALTFKSGSNTSQFQEFIRSTGAQGWVYFDESTRALYYTASDSPTTALDTAPTGTTGFSMVCLYDRAYICYHNYNAGIAGATMKVLYNATVNITSSNASSPANVTITCASVHNLVAGMYVNISGHVGSTPAISGVYQVLTVPTSTTFTIGVVTTVGGTGGSFTAWYFRAALGARPTIGTFAAAENVTAGNVAAGIHLFRVAYLTDTGFITRMTAGVSVTATGSRTVDLTNIPLGPANSGVIARWIICTKAIPAADYDGNPDAWPYYFLTLLNDNVTTTLTAVNFYDTALTDSADYLFNTLGSLPGAMGLTTYNGRLVSWGFPDTALTDYGYVWISRQNDPEVFLTTTGLNKIPAADGGSRSIFCCAEYRGSLFVFKRGKTYAGVDNGNEPSTWSFNLVDAGFGCEALFGVARVEAGQLGVHKETLFVANYNGLYAFQGSWADKPLSWKMEAIWRDVSELQFSRMKLCVQPTYQRIYALFPNSNGYNAGLWGENYLYYIDYSLGLDFQSVRWGKYLFKVPRTYGNGTAFAGISHLQTEPVNANSGNSKGVLISFYGTAQPGVWRMIENDGQADTLSGASDIPTLIVLSPASTMNENSYAYPDLSIGHIHSLRVAAKITAVTGTGSFTISVDVVAPDGSQPSASFSMSTSVYGQAPTFLTNLDALAMSISINAPGCNWTVNQATLFYNPVWEAGEM